MMTKRMMMMMMITMITMITLIDHLSIRVEVEFAIDEIRSIGLRWIWDDQIRFDVDSIHSSHLHSHRMNAHWRVVEIAESRMNSFSITND